MSSRRSLSSLGFLGLFGRSADLRHLDQALRGLDVHPSLVPEAVKLTTVRLVKDHAGQEDPPAASYASAAEVVAYCLIGAEAFAGANGVDHTLVVERRIERAVDSGDNLDAQLVLLTLHAGIIQPSVVDEYRLESTGR